MADIIGYAALTLNLFSMTMKNVLYLRMLSICANSMYIGHIRFKLRGHSRYLHNCNAPFGLMLLIEERAL